MAHKSPTSDLDWLELCDVAIAVRKRAAEGRFGPVVVSDHEMTVLVCAALEYSNRLAREAAEREPKRRTKPSPGSRQE